MQCKLKQNLDISLDWGALQGLLTKEWLDSAMREEKCDIQRGKGDKQNRVCAEEMVTYLWNTSIWQNGVWELLCVMYIVCKF